MKEDQDAGAGILPVSPTGTLLVGYRGTGSSLPHTIGLAGGHLKVGETPEEGAEREFREETGCHLPLGSLKLLAVQQWRSGYHTFLCAFEDEWVDFDPPEKYAHEHEWFKWMTLEELCGRPDLHPGLQQLLENNENKKEIEDFIQKVKKNS